MMLGNGTVTTYAYEADSALDSLTHNLAGSADDVAFAFNYNMANQVTAKGLDNQAYQWNAPLDKAETAIPNGLNQITKVAQGGLVFDLGYDNNGSLTGDGTWSYAYDVENRLKTATGPGVAATYEYDPLGRRSKKSGTGVATEIYLSDGVEEIADYDGAGVLLDYGASLLNTLNSCSLTLSRREAIPGTNTITPTSNEFRLPPENPQCLRLGKHKIEIYSTTPQLRWSARSFSQASTSSSSQATELGPSRMRFGKSPACSLRLIVHRLRPVFSRTAGNLSIFINSFHV